MVIFARWQETLDHPRARLDAKRRKVIAQALALGYTAAELCQAIQGCALTPHNMGHNDRGTRYDELGLILRDADHIDRFIRNSREPPRVLSPQERVEALNRRAGEEWLAKKKKAAADDQIPGADDATA